MRWFYVAVPILLIGCFLSFYVPWRIEDGNRFEMDGPGALLESVRISAVDWQFDKDDRETRAVIQDENTIAKVVALLAPDYGSWSRREIFLPKGGQILSFYAPEKRKHIVFYLGDNYVRCGQYIKDLTPATVSEIHAQLAGKGRIVSLREG